ncbi:hypothetical protein HGB07_00925 [Candidatus Roizmanbacteria bacterium]|nr:hypothetical protein [Candidatus Roizmanbacteria bacterium]
MFSSPRSSRQGIAAIRDYLDREREEDPEKLQAHTLFLASSVSPHGDGRLNSKLINTVWNQVRDFAGVDKDKTPHSARPDMRVFIMEKTGNVAQYDSSWVIKMPHFPCSIRV